MHERGVVFGDLHPFNIMVRPDDAVALIDFEVRARLDRATTSGRAWATRASPPRADGTGVEVDRYALACLRLALFLPMTQLLAARRAKVRAPGQR